MANNKSSSSLIWVILIIAAIAYFLPKNMASDHKSHQTEENTQSRIETQAFTYAQIAMEDFVPGKDFSNMEYLRNKKVVRTGNRFKIESKSNGNSFTVIIDWDPDSNKEEFSVNYASYNKKVIIDGGNVKFSGY